MPYMWRPRAGTATAAGETGNLATVEGMNSECCFLFLMEEADITCRPGPIFPAMYKGTGKR